MSGRGLEWSGEGARGGGRTAARATGLMTYAQVEFTSIDVVVYSLFSSTKKLSLAVMKEGIGTRGHLLQYTL